MPGSQEGPDERLNALAVNQAVLRAIFDTVTDAILTTNAAQRIVEANPAAARMFGMSAADLIGAPLERLIPARCHAAHRRAVEGFGAGAEPARRMGRTREVLGLRSDGEEFPIEASISHLEVDGERMYTVTLRDVTRRVQSQAALWESKNKLEAALASMNDAVYICDGDGRLFEFNDAFVSFYRFGSRAECNRTLAEYPDTFEAFMPDGTTATPDQWAVRRAYRGEAASNVEYLVRRKDTGESWVGSYSFSPIRSKDGQIVGAVVICRDITDIKRAQAELATAHTELQKLYANQDRIQEEERKRIARELHDDLQQTLAAIRMDTVAVSERLARGHGDVDGLLARIERLSAAAIASARRIVGDLRPEMLEELGLVDALKALCSQYAERTGMQCEVTALPGAADLSKGASAVTTCLYRIAQEALNNVAKHAQATVVSVRVDCTHDGLVLLRVRDNGIGMGPTANRQKKGFGLHGMAERLRALDGHLRIESESAGGTTIEVLVPITASATTVAAIPDPLPASGRSTLRAGKPAPAASAAGALDALGHPLQSVIDALPGNVSVLDQTGVIQSVNRAWREFAARHGDPDLRDCGPGVNYLDVCHRSATTDPSALPVLQGLRAVLQGQREAYVAEYPCDTSEGTRWYRLHAAPVTGGLAIVTHVDLSARVGAEGAPQGTARSP